MGLHITVFNHCSAYCFVVVEPPSNLIATEVSSKYVKLSWSPSPSAVTGYRVLLIPMTTGSRQHALSVGPQTTTLSIRDLSADTEYQISVSAMKGLTSSEPVSIMEKTQPMKVQVGELIGFEMCGGPFDSIPFWFRLTFKQNSCDVSFKEACLLRKPDVFSPIHGFHIHRFNHLCCLMLVEPTGVEICDSWGPTYLCCFIEWIWASTEFGMGKEVLEPLPPPKMQRNCCIYILWLIHICL